MLMCDKPLYDSTGTAIAFRLCGRNAQRVLRVIQYGERMDRHLYSRQPIPQIERQSCMRDRAVDRAAENGSIVRGKCRLVSVVFPHCCCCCCRVNAVRRAHKSLNGLLALMSIA